MTRSKATRSRLEVVPAGADLSGQGLQYEDFLAVRIECAGAIGKATARALATLYAGWCTRVERASRTLAKEDGDELLPIRFDGFVVTGARAQGGAARFLDAGAACRWLVAELARRPEVVRVVFGEEDVPATAAAAAPTPRALSPRAAAVDAVVARVFADEAGSARVLGCITVRFTGDGVAAPSKVLRVLIDEAVALAGDVGPIWVRGTWGESGSLSEVNQGRDLRDKGGRALLDQILTEVPTVPRESDDPQIVHLVLSDGPRPARKAGCWVDHCRVAASFGVTIFLQGADDCPPGGLFEVYVPLADLDDPDRRAAWVGFGARAFAALRGSVGAFEPALWMEELCPDDVPLALLAELPTVALPRMIGGHAGGFNAPAFSPGVHHGVFACPWITWLSPALAGAVRAFPGQRRTIPGGVELRVEDAAPLVMNDASYARYRAAATALGALGIRWSASDDDDRYPWRLALERLDAPSLGQLPALLARRLADRKERSRLYWSSSSALGNHKGKQAFAEAERAITLGATGHDLHATLLASTLCWRGSATFDPKAAAKALAVVERLPHAEQAALVLLTARVLLAATPGPRGQDRALAWLGAHAAGEPRPDALASDPAFAPIRDDDRFRRAVGWATRAEISAQGATPDLGGTFPKLARVLRTRPGTAAFGRPASAKAIDTMARAVGLAPRALPARYRALLATFDGATLQGGREVLYGCAQLAAHNPAGERDEHTPLVIGHNLVLQHSSASKNGEAPVSEVVSGVRKERTPLRWTTLDACLAELARGPGPAA
jgi:hypothetical protein